MTPAAISLLMVHLRKGGYREFAREPANGVATEEGAGATAAGQAEPAGTIADQREHHAAAE